MKRTTCRAEGRRGFTFGGLSVEVEFISVGNGSYCAEDIAGRRCGPVRWSLPVALPVPGAVLQTSQLMSSFAAHDRDAKNPNLISSSRVQSHRPLQLSQVSH